VTVNATIVHPISLGRVQAFLLVDRDQAVLVDAGSSPGHVDKVLTAMGRLGLEPSDLSLIVVTHAHADHCGALSEIHHRTGAQVAIQEGGAEVLRLGISAEIRPTGPLTRLFTLLVKRAPGYAGVDPDTVFGEELDLYPFGVDGRVLHTPGHTPCSSSVLLPNGEALVGDLVMGMPRPRVARLPTFATNPAQAQSSIRELLDLGVQTFYTAHGGPFVAEQVRALVS
jgi:glyoxylase-like metal-dependent hydrolase (beta-lactamase superfamily II)